RRRTEGQGRRVRRAGRGPGIRAGHALPGARRLRGAALPTPLLQGRATWLNGTSRAPAPGRPVRAGVQSPPSFRGPAPLIFLTASAAAQLTSGVLLFVLALRRAAGTHGRLRLGSPSAFAAVTRSAESRSLLASRTCPRDST